jgi:hypothetical protein
VIGIINELKSEPYESYSDVFMEFCNKFNIKMPKINSLRGQSIAMLTNVNNLNKGINRETLEVYFKSINYKSSDAIQTINKSDQWGLHWEKKDGYYYIPFPFQYVSLHVNKRKISKIGGNKDEKINNIKDFIKINYIDVPNELWQAGHKDPNKEDSDEDNLVYQPPIQGKYRDRFKYDDMGLLRIPTITELFNNFDKYYPNKEEKEEFKKRYEQKFNNRTS